MLTPQQMRTIIRDELVGQAAQIYDADTGSGFQFQAVEIDLSIAQSKEDPYKISFPFKSFVVLKGTDNTVELNVIFNTNGTGITPIPVRNNTAINSDRMFSEANLSWSAQSGKKVTVLVCLNARYESGSFTNDGTVSVERASALVLSNPAIAVGTNLLLAENPSRKKVTIQNKGLQSIYLGPIGVTASGATAGLELVVGADVSFEVTSNIYIYAANTSIAGTLTILEET